jgi:hypothetical protein
MIILDKKKSFDILYIKNLISGKYRAFLIILEIG